MPRYTPVIIALDDDGNLEADVQRTVGAFSDAVRFNTPIVLACSTLHGKGDIRRFDRRPDAWFCLLYAACAADRMYPYDPLMFVTARASAFELSRAVLGIDIAIHAVMKGRAVVLDPFPEGDVPAVMSVGRVMFPARFSRVHPVHAVLATSGTVVDLSTASGRSGYLPPASMALRHHDQRQAIPVPLTAADGSDRDLSDIVARWVLHDPYSVGGLAAPAPRLAS